MTRHDATKTWVRTYEQLWRTPGTDRLAELFAPDATYRTAPWAEPIAGLPAIAEFWEAGRDGPDESFTMDAQLVAVDGPTAVVRVRVDYDGGDNWRDLWILTFDDDGRCTTFEEWPFAPDQPDGQG